MMFKFNTVVVDSFKEQGTNTIVTDSVDFERYLHSFSFVKESVSQLNSVF